MLEVRYGAKCKWTVSRDLAGRQGSQMTIADDNCDASLCRCCRAAEIEAGQAYIGKSALT